MFAPPGSAPQAGATTRATVSGCGGPTARGDATLSRSGATRRGGTTAGREVSTLGNATNTDWEAALKGKQAELERERADRRKDQENLRKEQNRVQALQRQIAAIQENEDFDEDIDEDTLEALNITLVARLSLPRADSRHLDVSHITAQSKSLGTNAFMSSQRFHDHLKMLDMMVPWNDGSARTWIDAFFFRAAAMVPSYQSLIMSATQAQSPDVCLPLTHCASILPNDASPGIAYNLRCLASEPHEGFFLAQGRQFMLSDDIPRAVADLYAAAERAGQTVLRGALTNGCDWVFLILSRNSNGLGATYKESAVISLMERDRIFSSRQILEPWPDVIALLLSTWIQRRFTDFGEEDWLIVSWPKAQGENCNCKGSRHGGDCAERR
ncbi:hypothetical protein BDZ89DRAFT_1074750 [Hymenopellis radicata]|nr:hypothetical protein BDZ89DRAFT_1074750 [Hymenopellis radicata]